MLKAAQTDSARNDQLMADAAKPEDPAQPEPPTEVEPRMEDRRSRVVTTRVSPFAAWHMLDFSQRDTVRTNLAIGDLEWMRGAAWAYHKRSGSSGTTPAQIPR